MIEIRGLVPIYASRDEGRPLRTGAKMRLKNVPGSGEKVAASRYTVTEPAAWRGRWQTLFAAPRPLHLEIGMGKGRFLTEMAQAHPGIHYVGLEKYSSVLVRAVEKQEELQLPNLILVQEDAANLSDCFAEGEVERIYLNFPDPWPKDRHAKRRLTSGRFLERYDSVLVHGGLLEFKTDNQALFDYSLESIRGHGWEILEITRDLHRSAMAGDNVMTEYEEKFSKLGSRICKLTARRP